MWDNILMLVFYLWIMVGFLIAGKLIVDAYYYFYHKRVNDKVRKG